LLFVQAPVCAVPVVLKVVTHPPTLIVFDVLQFSESVTPASVYALVDGVKVL